jgi:phosphatidylethanolamine-binding protein (PEBP) family uncharacterized protein
MKCTVCVSAVRSITLVRVRPGSPIRDDRTGIVNCVPKVSPRVTVENLDRGAKEYALVMLKLGILQYTNEA